ncbi:MAG: riboflavin kinase [Patescibacteria group bacterium]
MRYSVRGRVIKGDGWGHTIGYPTANLDRRYFRRHPVPKGVWACKVKIQNPKLVPSSVAGSKIQNNGLWLKGIAVIGVQGKVEVYILDFDKNIYGWHCEAEVVKKIRLLKSFHSQAELTAQIKKDVLTARSMLG